MRIETKTKTQGKVFISPSLQTVILQVLFQTATQTNKKSNTFLRTFLQKSRIVSEASSCHPITHHPQTVADFGGAADPRLKAPSACYQVEQLFEVAKLKSGLAVIASAE